MSRFDALHPFEQWGTISVHDLGEHERARNGQPDGLVVHRERHIWRARNDPELPNGFELVLECEEGPDSIRRWTPADATAFVLHASQIGHSILEQAGLLTEEQSRSYSDMRLFFQLSSRVGAYLRRQFKRKSDLVVSRVARVDAAVANVLPADVGCAAGSGAPWSVEELLAQAHDLKPWRKKRGAFPSSRRNFVSGWKTCSISTKSRSILANP